MINILWFCLGGVFGGLLGAFFMARNTVNALKSSLWAINYFEEKWKRSERDFTEYVINIQNRGQHGNNTIN